MNAGMTMSGINFDASALQAIDEEELQREEQAQQDELKDFLSKQLGDFVDSELDSASDGGQTGANSDDERRSSSSRSSASDSSSCSRSASHSRRSKATHSDCDSASTCSSASRSTPTPKQAPDPRRPHLQSRMQPQAPPTQPTQLDAAASRGDGRPQLDASTTGELAFDPNTGLPLSFDPTLSGMPPFGVSPMHPLFQPSADLLARLGMPLNAGTMFDPHAAADSLAVAAALGFNPLAIGPYPLPVGVLPFLPPPPQPSAGIGADPAALQAAPHATAMSPTGAQNATSRMPKTGTLSGPDSGIALPPNTANTSGGSASTTSTLPAKQQPAALAARSSGTGSTSSLKSDSTQSASAKSDRDSRSGLPKPEDVPSHNKQPDLDDHSPPQFYDAAKLEMLYKARGRRIDELGREIERLRDEQKRELFTVRHRLALVEADRDGARSSLEQTQALLVVARDTVTALERRVRELETSLARANETAERHAEAERLARAQVEELNARVTELSNSAMLNKMKDQQAALLGSVRAQHSDAVNDLERRLRDTEASLRSRDEEIDRWRAKFETASRQCETALTEKLNTMQQLAAAQKQCEQLLDSSAMHELAKLRSTVKQLEAAKRMTDEVHAAVQDEVRELKEQLTLYESAARCGVPVRSETDASALSNQSSVLAPGSNATSQHENDASQCDSAAATAASSQPQTPVGALREPPKATRLEFRPSPDSPNVSAAANQAAATSTSATTLRSEFERCLAAYRQKRMQLARANDEAYNARKEIGELRKRIERFEELVREQRAEIERLEERARSIDPLVNELRFKKELDAARADRERLDAELREARSRLTEATANEAQLSELNADLNRQISQLVREFDRDKQETFEKFQSTCEAHYERCRETFRSELSAQFHEERNRLVADFEAQLAATRDELDAERAEIARVKTAYVELCDEKQAALDRLGESHTAALAALETRLRDEAARELAAAIERCESALKAAHATDCERLRERLDAAAQEEIRQQVELRVALGKVHWLDEQTQLRQLAIETTVNKTRAELEEQFEKQLEEQLDSRIAKLKPRLESELREVLKNEYEETLLVERARLENELDARLAAAERRTQRETGSALVQTESADSRVDTADACTNTEAADDLSLKERDRERDRDEMANLKIRIGELERELAAFRGRDGELRSLAERYRRRAHELEQKLVEMRTEFDENAALRRAEFDRTMKDTLAQHARALEQRRNEQRDALVKLEADCDARVRQVQDELRAERQRELAEHARQVTELKDKYDALLDRFAAPQPNASGPSGANYRSMVNMSLNETSSTVTLLSVIREQETRIGSLENAALERDVRVKQLETQLAEAHDELTAARAAKQHADEHYRDRIAELKQRLAEKLGTIANEKQLLVTERDQLRARLEHGAAEQRDSLARREDRVREMAERYARNVETLKQEAKSDKEALARTLTERFDVERRKLLDQFDAERRTLQERLEVERRTLESQLDTERRKVEEIEAAQRRAKASEAERSASLRSSFVQTDAGPNENLATSFALGSSASVSLASQSSTSSSSVVLELRSQYLEAIAKIKREAIEHVNATVSRAARTLKTEIVRDRRNTITRLKRAFVEQASEKHLTDGTDHRASTTPDENTPPINNDSAELIRLFDQAVTKWAINASNRSLNGAELNVSERDRDDALTSRPLNASSFSLSRNASSLDSVNFSRIEARMPAESTMDELTFTTVTPLNQSSAMHRSTLVHTTPRNARSPANRSAVQVNENVARK